jgi:hypothetical protein
MVYMSTLLNGQLARRARKTFGKGQACEHLPTGRTTTSWDAPAAEAYRARATTAILWIQTNHVTVIEDETVH